MTLPLHFEPPEIRLMIDKAAIDEAYKLSVVRAKSQFAGDW